MQLKCGTLFVCRIEQGRIILEKIWEEPDQGGGKVILSESDQRYELNCFGRFSLMRDARPARVEKEKARELLAFLACERGRPSSKRRAAEALWPGRTEAQAVDSLYKVCRYLQECRQRGEAPAVRAARGQLWLDMAQINCDLERFYALSGPAASLEELRQAAELYRGPLLVEEGYEWSEDWEGFYDLRYLDVLARLHAALQQLGREREALRYARLLGQD